jgi:hypothetical protein
MAGSGSDRDCDFDASVTITITIKEMMYASKYAWSSIHHFCKFMNSVVATAKTLLISGSLG